MWHKKFPIRGKVIIEEIEFLNLLRINNVNQGETRKVGEFLP